MRYVNVATEVIAIDLPNTNYTVIAMNMYDKKSDMNYSTLYLKRYNIDTLDMMEKFENIEFDCARHEIRTELLKYISNKHKDGEFNYYIDRAEYDQKCYEIGNDIFECENLSNVAK